jgi:hypothetical protein
MFNKNDMMKKKREVLFMKKARIKGFMFMLAIIGQVIGFSVGVIAADDYNSIIQVSACEAEYIEENEESVEETDDDVIISVFNIHDRKDDDD